MTNASIKIVRPWPAEQPRPPVTRRTESMKAAPVNLADRPVKTKAAQAL
jgi:hypothetical protein